MLRRIQEQGFTLLELTIAMGVLSVGLLAVATMVHTVMHSNRQSQHLTTAINLAQSKIDELRVADYAEIADDSEYDLDENENAGSGIFDRAVSVGENLTPTMKTVTVTVSWGDPNPRHVTMGTIIAQ